MNQKGQTTEIILFIIMTVLLLLVGIFVLMFRFSSLGEGKHTGYITAIEQEGYFFPNYHVYVKTDNSSSQEDEYCLNRNNTDLANKLKEFSKNRQLVSISFRGVRGLGLGLCQSPEISDVDLDVK